MHQVSCVFFIEIILFLENAFTSFFLCRFDNFGR